MAFRPIRAMSQMRLVSQLVCRPPPFPAMCSPTITDVTSLCIQNTCFLGACGLCIQNTCFLGACGRRTFTGFNRTLIRPQQPLRKAYQTPRQQNGPIVSVPTWNPAHGGYRQQNHYSSRDNRPVPNFIRSKYAWYLVAFLTVVPFVISCVTKPGSSRYRWLEDNFVLNQINAQERPWTLITCGFMHANLGHIFFNLFTLRTAFDILASTANMSPSNLIALHLAGILGGSVVACSVTAELASSASDRGDELGRLRAERRGYVGASAGVSGALVAAAFHAPRFPINIMFVPIGIPLAAAVAGFMALDAYLMGNPTSLVAHEGHLGGAVAGALFWLLRMR